MATIGIRRGAVLRLLAVAAVAVVVGLLVGRGSLPTTAQSGEPGYTYSAKFLCGTIGEGEGPLADGEYATAINVHNLQDYNVHVFKKAVRAPSGSNLGQPSPWKDLVIPPDAAFEIDCPDIAQLLLLEPPFLFLKGFAVIQSPVELDVWGVYTSALTLDSSTAGTDISEDIEVVPHRRQPFNWGCDGGADTDCDGCSDQEENVTGLNKELLGGNRDYLDPWDYYDVPLPVGAPGATKNKSIDLDDTFGVLAKFGSHPTNPPGAPLYDTAYDRSAPTGGYPGPTPWLTEDPWIANNGVQLDEVFWNLTQFGHSCFPPP